MGASIAKFCGFEKQHFASPAQQTAAMRQKSINQIVSEALRYYMGTRWNQTTLGEAAKVSANK
jgi:hypothetical protein